MLLRYFFGKGARQIVLVLITLLALRLLGRLAQALEQVFSGVMPLDIALLSIGYLLPYMLQTILPVAFIVGLVMAVSRLWSNGEIISALYIGVKPIRLLMVAVILALATILFYLSVSAWLVPSVSCVGQDLWRNERINFALIKAEPYLVQSIEHSQWSLSVAGRDGTKLLSPVLVELVDEDWSVISADTIEFTVCPDGAVAESCPLVAQLQGNVRLYSSKDGTMNEINVEELTLTTSVYVQASKEFVCKWSTGDDKYLRELIHQSLNILLLLVLLPLALVQTHASNTWPFLIVFIASLIAIGSVDLLVDQPWRLALLYQGAMAFVCGALAVLWKHRFGSKVKIL